MPKGYTNIFIIINKAERQMRIITGKAKGIKLVTLEGDTTRPTAERVKEAVFSMLQFDIEGRRVLDLFAGSGQLALEAVSRGAAEAVLVDKSKDAIKVISTNIAKTKSADTCRVYCLDWKDYIRRFGKERFDIIFLDPPYAAGLYAPALAALVEENMLKPTTLIVCESDSAEIFAKNAELAKKFREVKVSRYSRTVITVLSPAAESEEGE
jgi:16S rRNA (guanine(966)-N(2))-methyltransferase RsmD